MCYKKTLNNKADLLFICSALVWPGPSGFATHWFSSPTSTLSGSATKHLHPHILCLRVKFENLTWLSLVGATWPLKGWALLFWYKTQIFSDLTCLIYFLLKAKLTKVCAPIKGYCGKYKPHLMLPWRHHSFVGAIWHPGLTSCQYSCFLNWLSLPVNIQYFTKCN